MQDDSGKLMATALSPLMLDLGSKMLELALVLDGKVCVGVLILELAALDESLDC